METLVNQYMLGRTGKLRRERLTKSVVLELLRKKDESTYTSILRSGILEWNLKDYTEYDRKLEENGKVLEALTHRFWELADIELKTWGHSLNFFHLPELRLNYKKKDNVNCLDWVSRVHVVVDVEVRIFQRYYFEEYFSPEDTGLESIFLFRTPISLLKYLIGETTTSPDVEVLETSSKMISYGVRGFPDEIELPKSFIPWIKEFCNEKGFSFFLDKMLDIKAVDHSTYVTIMSSIKSKAEPIIEYSELGDKDLERLRKINHVKDHHFYSWWGKNILGLTSRQGPKDYLEKMEAGGYVRVYKGENGARVELTDKGLKAIA